MNISKISVAMATYNGEKYISEQLKSILNNLNENDEIIISDDGSTDSTISIINSFNDKRIKIIDGPKKGIISNFENAIRNTTGDLIFLSDQDDIWKPNKVEIVLKKFQNDKELLLIVHDNVIIDENNKIIDNSFFRFRKVRNGFINNIIKNSFIGCCMCFKKELIPYIIPIPQDMPMHDQWIGLIALTKGKVVFLNEKLLEYRRHSNNNSSFKKNSIYIMIKNRILIIKNILKRR